MFAASLAHRAACRIGKLGLVLLETDYQRAKVVGAHATASDGLILGGGRTRCLMPARSEKVMVESSEGFGEQAARPGKMLPLGRVRDPPKEPDLTGGSWTNSLVSRRRPRSPLRKLTRPSLTRCCAVRRRDR